MVLGYEDPQLTNVARDSPTLTREGRSVILQTIASRKWRLQSFDIKTAFLRGKADPKNRLAMNPPSELRKLMNLRDDEDPCIFVLQSGDGSSRKLHGVVGMHVDDGLCGGDSKFQALIQKLQKHLPFGSQKESRFTFTGNELDQLPDMSIRACQKHYIESILPIHVARDRR